MTKYLVEVIRNGNFVTGTATIIGAEPNSIPYINIQNDSGDLLVSISRRQMNNIIKGWKAANLKKSRKVKQ